MTKNNDVVIPRSKLTAHMPPGAATPRSGIYEQVGSRSGLNGRQVESVRGKSLTPIHGPGRGWTLTTPAYHKGDKQR